MGEYVTGYRARAKMESRHDDLPFNLHDGENVQIIVKADRAKFLIKNMAIVYLVLATALFMLFIIIPAFISISITAYGMAVLSVVVIVGIAVYAVTELIYDRLTFWITDQRIVNRSGLIGYTIRSIPLATITDLIIHRGIFDMVLGSSDILMPTINNTTYNLYRHRSGVNHMPSLNCDAAREVQKAMFMIKDNTKTEGVSLYGGYFVT